MPGLHTMLNRINYEFSVSANVDQPSPIEATAARITAGASQEGGFVLGNLPAYLDSDGHMGISDTYKQMWYRVMQDELPPAVNAAFSHALYSALTASGGPTQIFMSWVPGYDYKVVVTHSPPADLGGGEKSPACVHIELTTRYPGDPHPLPAK